MGPPAIIIAALDGLPPSSTAHLFHSIPSHFRHYLSLQANINRNQKYQAAQNLSKGICMQ
jgi:hypothetical protein